MKVNTINITNRNGDSVQVDYVRIKITDTKTVICKVRNGTLEPSDIKNAIELLRTQPIEFSEFAIKTKFWQQAKTINNLLILSDIKGVTASCSPIEVAHLMVQQNATALH